jgi:hypothetical protein
MDGMHVPMASLVRLHGEKPISLRDFLELVLPEQGLYCLAYTKDTRDNNAWRHETFNSIEEMAKRCDVLEADGSWQIFFSPSSFVNPFDKPREPLNKSKWTAKHPSLHRIR